MKRPFTLIAAILFAVIAVVHIYRLTTGLVVTIGGHIVENWISWVALIVSGGLALLLYRETKN